MYFVAVCSVPLCDCETEALVALPIIDSVSFSFVADNDNKTLEPRAMGCRTVPLQVA